MVVWAPHNVSHSLANGIRLFVNPRYVFSRFEYLFINSNNTSPATSVNVKWVFSHGRLILSHVHSHLLVQSTCALICLGSWSLLGLVKNMDILAITALDDVKGMRSMSLKMAGTIYNSRIVLHIVPTVWCLHVHEIQTWKIKERPVACNLQVAGTGKCGYRYGLVWTYLWVTHANAWLFPICWLTTGQVLHAVARGSAVSLSSSSPTS